MQGKKINLGHFLKEFSYHTQISVFVTVKTLTLGKVFSKGTNLLGQTLIWETDSLIPSENAQDLFGRELGMNIGIMTHQGRGKY